MLRDVAFPIKSCRLLKRVLPRWQCADQTARESISNIYILIDQGSTASIIGAANRA
jgi:hypothetical protein